MARKLMTCTRIIGIIRVIRVIRDIRAIRAIRDIRLLGRDIEISKLLGDAVDTMVS
jgi:hypothetical protein